MKHIRSYPKVYNLGHKAIENLLVGSVVVEEKVDGSQLSAAVCPMTEKLLIRSHHADIDLDAPPKMFRQGVETLKELHERKVLRPGTTYRFEYLQKPKHNALAYNRIPKGHLVLLDVDRGEEAYVPPNDKGLIADILGLEPVPMLLYGDLATLPDLEALLDRESFLGGPKIEGVVIKNYAQFGRDGKALMGKHVSADFREVHKKEWKKVNPGGKDIIDQLVERYRTEGRWAKAVQHLREAGTLQDSPPDIGPLLKEVCKDVREECGDEIRDRLFRWAWKQISRRITHGLPEWYKKRLLEAQFAPGDSEIEEPDRADV